MDTMIEGLFPVDAGNIAVLSAHRATPGGEDLQKVVVLPAPGLYKVRIEVFGCWRGRAVKSGELNFPTGRAIVGDACYASYPKKKKVADSWLAFLDETKYLDEGGDFLLSADTGGDGRFRVVVTFEAVPCETCKGVGHFLSFQGNGPRAGRYCVEACGTCEKYECDEDARRARRNEQARARRNK